MRFRKNYLNCKLSDIPYLLPYGQDIVDHAAGIQVNTVSARLWEAICQGADRERLLSLLKAEYDAADDDLPALQKDLDAFLAALSCQNLLLADEPTSTLYPERMMRIGPLLISVKLPDALWETYFSDFECHPDQTACQDRSDSGSDHADSKPHQQITLCPRQPTSHPNGEILIRSRELLIAQTEEAYLFLPLTDSAFSELHVTKDGAKARLYCRPTLSDADMEELFHAIRFAFLVVAAQHDLYVIHSASLLYRGKAWLFSGSSGTGKSTHTALWKTAYDTPLLNGDLNMIGLENGIPMCYGLPWCGTSGIRTVKNLPLGGITLLKQFSRDEIITLSPDKQILHLMQRIISPSWTPSQLTQMIAFCEQLVGLIPIYRLRCTKEPRAAELMRMSIDQYLDSLSTPVPAD